MNKKQAWLLVTVIAGLILLLTGCNTATPEISPSPTEATPTDALLRTRGKLFSTSGECAYCHTGMTDAAGQDVSIDSAWRSTMMANSTRDPYYRASVRSEVLTNPEHQAAIEKKCSICHIGMAYHTAENDGTAIAMLPNEGFLDKSHALYPFAADGVSCSLCHQITASGLGTTDSFSGEYDIDRTTAQGERVVFGHFAIDDATAIIMSNASGFNPQQADHVKQAEICAVCHNLFTPYITNEGDWSTELFPEQTPHLEWLHSVYQKGTSCQGCHMPAAEGEVMLANTGSPPRSPFPQHTFAGGNAYMISLLSNNRVALGVTATREQLEDTRLSILGLLQEKSARLSVTADQEESTLTVKVNTVVQTGHKFPSSFPSRRVWLHVIVKDSAEKIIFESGGWKPNGMILENDNDLDGTLYEPHYSVITSPDQIQIYETIIGDPNGEVTTTLLRAQTYLKDNRLLPAGFDKATADEAIAVCGEALTDQDFKAGGDQVLYQIPAAPGAYTVEVELLYQSIGYRWAEKFRDEENPEGAEFYGYTDAMANSPILIASQSVTVK